MATALLTPLLTELDSKLLVREKEEAIGRFHSVLGGSYSSMIDFLPLLTRCTEDNKINPSNTFMLEVGLSSDPKKRKEIRSAVERFKEENSSAIAEWKREQPSEFVGRDIRWLGNILESHGCVILWGASGVGKTKLARTYMNSRTEIDQKVVDLRNIKTMQLIYVETLKQFGKLVSIDDVTQGLVSDVIKNHVKNHQSMLLFDNADDFIHYPGVGVDLTSEFASLVKEILQQTSLHNIKMIITSRNKSEHPDASVLYQEELKSLKDEDASSIIKSGMIHEKDKDSEATNKLVMTAINQCRNLPLNLNVLGAALQEQGIKLDLLLPSIKKKAEEWKASKEKEKVKLPEEDFYTHAVLASRFEQLSDTTQLAAVALSLFTRSFSSKSVNAVLKDYEDSKVNLILIHLKGIRFLNEDKTSVYDMHPKVREFLMGKVSSSPEINDYYLKAKKNFILYYKEQLTNIARLVDDDYLKAYDLYMANSSDFDFIFREEDNEFILVDSYDDNQNIVSLLNGMIEPSRKLELFKNLSETAFNRGKILQATQHLCHTAIADSFYNPNETFDFTLLRIQHTLENLKKERKYFSKDMQLDHLRSLHNYARGEVLYRMIRANHSISDCQAAVESSKECIEIRERLDEDCNTDTIRSYINLGNIYNVMEDIHRRNENFGETGPCLDKALEAYNKAYEMRLKLSPPDGLHVDMPQIQSNIGTIWMQRGVLLRMMDRRAGRYEENQRALEHFKEAEKWFQDSLKTEEQLKLDGLYETSVKLVNLGDLQRNVKKRGEAVKTLLKALEIRKILKGDHEDVVLVLYRLGSISMDMQEFKEAAGYYKEAFEMDNRLPVNFHSLVRKEIRRYLIAAYNMWGHRDKKESRRINEERKDLESKIKELEKEENEREKEATKQGKGGATRLKPAGDGMDISTTAFLSNMASCEKYVDGEFDNTGGHLSFRYVNASLTIPRNLTDDMQAIRMYCMKEEDIEMKLKDSESLVSGVIRLESKFSGILKSPAMLEIRCDILVSRVENFCELYMIQYDPECKRWIDVEKCTSMQRRFYWYDENDRVPIIQAWINRFSMFAVVARPKRKLISVPSSGVTWSPVEDGRISLEFPPSCFGEAESTICSVKVIQPESNILKSASEQFKLLLSPAVHVDVKESVARPIKVSLPLLDAGLSKKAKKEGHIKILKKEDSAESDFKIEELKPVFKDDEKVVITVEVRSFSWVMAIWSLSQNVAEESLKWITDKMFRLFQYDVDLHLFKRTAVDDSIIIGVSCTPVKTNDLHWLQRLGHGKESGYEFVDSAPSLERIDNGTSIQVTVTGQYVIPSSGFNSFRFNVKNFSPTPMALRESQIRTDDRWVVFHNMKDKLSVDAKLCGIPYHRDFKLVSDNEAERGAFWRNKPLRFLGLKLEKCGLECLHALHNAFRNNLWRTGMDEAFIDGLKTRDEPVRLVLDEISRLFVEDGLAQNWFSIFANYTHPESLKKNLSNVMEILNRKLQCQNWHKIQEEIECGNEGSRFLQNLASRLQMNDDESMLDFKEAMNEFVKENTMMDLVRKLLQLKRDDGYLEETDKILDKLGEVIEDWMQVIHH